MPPQAGLSPAAASLRGNLTGKESFQVKEMHMAIRLREQGKAASFPAAVNLRGKPTGKVSSPVAEKPMAIPRAERTERESLAVVDGPLEPVLVAGL